MKRMLSLLIVVLLCLALPLCAAAETKRTANCGVAGHYRGDGMNHDRPEPCWIKGHNYCDGMDHNWAPCGYKSHFNCDGRTHEAAVCGAEGHTACYGGEHAAAACGIAGHCVIDDMNHRAAPCGTPGHYRCDGMNHYAGDCGKAGHGGCDGADHTRGECGKGGHYNCDGVDHSRAECGKYGHCVSDGKKHAPAACGYVGHFACDGRNHDLAACGVEGHFACEVRAHEHKPISKYCSAVPQHMTCQANDALHYCDPAMGGCGDEYACRYSNAHTPCRMCGQLWCDYSLGGHETPCNKANHRPCVYAMNGKTYVKYDHDWCGYCGDNRCDNNGEHGNTKCVDPCPKCGGPEKMHKSHLLKCKSHWSCKIKDSETKHTAKCKDCGKYLCLCECPADAK